MNKAQSLPGLLWFPPPMSPKTSSLASCQFFAWNCLSGKPSPLLSIYYQPLPSHHPYHCSKCFSDFPKHLCQKSDRHSSRFSLLSLCQPHTVLITVAISLETLGDWLLLLSSFSKLFSEVWAWDISVWISLGLSCSELTKLLNWRLVSHPNLGEFSAISLLRTFSVLPSFPSTGISKTQMSGPLRICSFSLPLVYFLSVVQIGECLWLCLQIHWFFPLSSPFFCIAHPVWFCFGYCLFPF